MTTRFLGLKLGGMEIRIEPRGLVEVWSGRRRRRLRLVPGFAIVVDGSEWQPYVPRRTAEREVRLIRAEAKALRPHVEGDS